MHFYATKADLVPVLTNIEAGNLLTYARYGSYLTPVFPAFDSGLELPLLGVASSDSAVSCDAYVVVSRGVEVIPREIQRSDGVRRYAVDQLLNPQSITFHPGGLRSPGALLHGRVATAATTAESRRLLGRFNRALKKSFRKVAAFYVGPEAFSLLVQGTRLTMALRSPSLYDLKLPDQATQPA